MKKFRLSREAAQDIATIFEYIASDNIDTAERVREDIYVALKHLCKNPGLGHKRQDLTNRNLLFWPLYSFLIIYDPKTRPLQIVAVLHGHRNVKGLLTNRR